MNPTVACIMLTRDRPQMARRAVECFRAQDYSEKHLIIYNQNSARAYGEIPGIPGALRDVYDGVSEVAGGDRGLTIGTARNKAIEHARMAQIIIHWDDDDWSHPSRISEQVALLESSGADVVGYREMLFWRKIPSSSTVSKHPDNCECGTCCPEHREVISAFTDIGSAWLYTNNDPRYCVGSSLCYWRKAWERQPFRDLMRSEDREFVKGLNSVGISCIRDAHFEVPMVDVTLGGMLGAPADVNRRYISGIPEFTIGKGEIDPRMICSIHGGNTQSYDLERVLKGSQSFRREPRWDEHCRRTMQI